MSCRNSPDRCSGMAYMNAINVIAPYKYNGMWVFDDPQCRTS